MADEVLDDVGELEAVEQQIVAEEAKVEVAEDVDIPKQFRGKQLKDVAKYAADLEKSLSRQGNELGELRRLTDDIIKSQLNTKPKEEAPKEVDFFENPQEAVNRAVTNNPAVQQAQQYAMQAQRALAKQQFFQMHPDAGTLVSDPEFQEYVNASKVRQSLLKAADQNYDLEAGNELFSTFKQLKQLRMAQSQEVDKTSRKEAMSAAAVDIGGTGEAGKKYYSRRALRELQMKNPAKFAQMADVINAAYADGRIKP
jgi:hypothetical protein